MKIYRIYLIVKFGFLIIFKRRGIKVAMSSFLIRPAGSAELEVQGGGGPFLLH